MTSDPAITPAPDVTTRAADGEPSGGAVWPMTGTGRSPACATGTAGTARPDGAAESGDIARISAPADLTDLAGGDHGTGFDGTTEPLTAEVPEPVYAAIEDWVTGYFLPMFRRTLGGEFRWCAQWWQHAEAISRLTVLWHAWEVLRLQPGTGIGTWYRDHLDHQLPILMGARGPFYQCSETAHREPHEAIAIPAPDGWWDVGRAEPDGDDDWWDDPADLEPGWLGPAGSGPGWDEPDSEADRDELAGAGPGRGERTSAGSGTTHGGEPPDGAAASAPPA